MGFAVAEKGLLWLDIEARSPGGHASRALHGETAVMKLAALLARIDAINDTYATVPPELAGVTGGEGNLGLRAVAQCRNDRGRHGAQPGRDRGRGRSSISGFRPASPRRRARPMLREKARWRRHQHHGGEVVGRQLDRARQSAGGRAGGGGRGGARGAAGISWCACPGSDARRWRDLGVPAVCYGPQPTLSAGIDDYANEQDVVDCAKIYARTALALDGPVTLPRGLQRRLHHERQGRARPPAWS